MQAEAFLLCSKGLATGPYPEVGESSPQPPTLFP
jgi:hypothetical protein